MGRPTEAQLRAELARYGRLLARKDYAPATSGNLSARLGKGLVLVTPTGMSKGELTPEDLVLVDAAGKTVRGRRAPTSELSMHLAVYEERPDAEAVVHAHPPTATGFACAGLALDQPWASEFIQAVGCAPLAPYGTPGTKELPDSLRAVARGNDAILLANHGAVTIGKDLFDAFGKMELVEHFARVALVVRQLGKEKPLSEAEIGKLLEARARYFGLDKTPPRDPACPRSASAAQAAPPAAAPSAPSGERTACAGEGGGPKAADVERVVREVLSRLR